MMQSGCNTMAQITETLPKENWNTVTIIENNDPVVTLSSTTKLELANDQIQVRKKVGELLQMASEYLPDEYSLYIAEGIRSPSDQQKAWDKSYVNIQKEFPNENEEFWTAQNKLLVAEPTLLANHNCGGAIDVNLKYKNNFADMGPESDYSKTQMFSTEISGEQKTNRTILREAMEKAGFAWYPGEWWHYCYGDRMWAVYTHRTECFYGPIQNIV